MMHPSEVTLCSLSPGSIVSASPVMTGGYADMGHILRYGRHSNDQLFPSMYLGLRESLHPNRFGKIWLAALMCPDGQVRYTYQDVVVTVVHSPGANTQEMG